MDGKKLNLLDQEICTREDFIRSFRNKKNAVKAVSVLDSRKIFPLTYGSPQFPLLNVLGLNVYFTGSISACENNHFDVHIAGGKAQQRDLTELVKSSLGLVLKPRQRKSDGNESLGYEFRINGGIYGRLLAMMGFHTGRKAENGSRLPQYLSYAIDRFRSLGSESQRVVRSLLDDLVTVCIDTKGSIRGRESRNILYIELLTQPEYHLVHQQGEQILQAIRFSHPEIKLEGDELSVDRINSGKSVGKFDGRIRLYSDQLKKSLPALAVQLKLRTATYSFEH